MTFYLTCAGDAVNSRSKVLDDGHGASLDSQDAGKLEDHVLGAGTAAELPGQLDTDHLGALELPGDVRHHVHAAGFPGSESVLSTDGSQEVVNIAVDVQGAGEVLVSLDSGLDQVVKVAVTSEQDSNLHNRVLQIKEFIT